MNGLTFSGCALLIVGIIAACGGMMMDCFASTPYGPVYNLSRGHQQNMIVGAGATATLAGVILFGFGALSPKARPLPKHGRQKRADLLRQYKIKPRPERPQDDFLDSLR
jgi:hypothetical protein